MTWHLEAEAIARYDAGLSDGLASASVEAHLERCASCRQLITTEDGWLERRWEVLAKEVYRPTPVGVEGLLHMLGVPVHYARLLAVTPALQPAWLMAVTVALLFAAFAGTGRLDLYLWVAPLVPVLGVAAAYGGRGDPAHEIHMSTPLDPVRLLLIRVVAVSSVAFILAAAVDLVTRGQSRFGLWLLPSLALVVLTLALGTRISMWHAAMVSTAIWIVFLTGTYAEQVDMTTADILGGRSQAGFLVLAAMAGFVFSARARRVGGL